MPVPLYLSGVVKIVAFLDLEQISADFEIERFETGSIIRGIGPFSFENRNNPIDYRNEKAPDKLCPLIQSPA